MAANKYRKKPVCIEAMQITELNWADVAEWSKGNLNFCPLKEVTETNPRGICWLVNTLEGITKAVPQDFIIKGVNGEFYPCKSDIFEKVYEPV